MLTERARIYICEVDSMVQIENRNQFSVWIYLFETMIFVWILLNVFNIFALYKSLE